MTARLTRRLATTAVTGLLAAAAFAGPADAAPNGSGCNTQDANGVSACYVNLTGGGWSLTVYNRRNETIRATHVLDVGARKNKTYTSRTGTFREGIFVAKYQGTKIVDLVELQRAHFTSARP